VTVSVEAPRNDGERSEEPRGKRRRQPHRHDADDTTTCDGQAKQRREVQIATPERPS